MNFTVKALHIKKFTVDKFFIFAETGADALAFSFKWGPILSR
jgi:hypothetical protein